MKENTGTQKDFTLREIDLWLDSYDDIFSDFDLRPFSERNISGDFLHELKRNVQEEEHYVDELKLLLSEKLRNAETEDLIKKRLKAHFVKNYHFYLKNWKRERIKSLRFILLGIVLIAGASFISSLQSAHILIRILQIIFEPAGWFFSWIGMESIIMQPQKKVTDLDFYTKMAKSKISFYSSK